MKAHFLLLPLLFLLVAWFFGHYAPPLLNKSSSSLSSSSYFTSKFYQLFFNGNAPLDHYIVVFNWGPGYCQLKPCNGKQQSKFYMHGVWPKDASEGDPLPPSTDSPTTAIKGLKPDLDKAWIAIGAKYSTNEDFWIHEWDKHGVYSQLQYPQDFFKLVIQKSNRIHLQQYLDNAGIVPHSTQTNTTLEIEAAIKKGIGRPNDHIIVKCEKDTQGRNLLYEVRLCLDAARNPKTCGGYVPVQPCIYLP